MPARAARWRSSPSRGRGLEGGAEGEGARRSWAEEEAEAEELGRRKGGGEVVVRGGRSRMEEGAPAGAHSWMEASGAQLAGDSPQEPGGPGRRSWWRTRRGSRRRPWRRRRRRAGRWGRRDGPRVRGHSRGRHRGLWRQRRRSTVPAPAMEAGEGQARGVAGPSLAAVAAGSARPVRPWGSWAVGAAARALRLARRGLVFGARCMRICQRREAAGARCTWPAAGVVLGSPKGDSDSAAEALACLDGAGVEREARCGGKSGSAPQLERGPPAAAAAAAAVSWSERARGRSSGGTAHSAPPPVSSAAPRGGSR